jgi:hypothetical protein
MNTRSFILAGLISGVVIGLLGNLPLLNLINCILCLWVWLGGIFAVWLYRRYEPNQAVTAGQGAGLGAVSGLVGAVVGSVVFALTSAISMPMMNTIAQVLQIEGTESLNTGGFPVMLMTTGVFFCINLVLYPLFGAVGGLIAGSIWKTAKAPVEVTTL